MTVAKGFSRAKLFLSFQSSLLRCSDCDGNASRASIGAKHRFQSSLLRCSDCDPNKPVQPCGPEAFQSSLLRCSDCDRPTI